MSLLSTWLIDWFSDWLTQWVLDWLIYWFIDWLLVFTLGAGYCYLIGWRQSSPIKFTLGSRFQDFAFHLKFLPKERNIYMNFFTFHACDCQQYSYFSRWIRSRTVLAGVTCGNIFWIFPFRPAVCQISCPCRAVRAATACFRKVCPMRIFQSRNSLIFSLRVTRPQFTFPHRGKCLLCFFSDHHPQPAPFVRYFFGPEAARQ